MSLRIGIDIGSTTVKVVVLDEQNQLLFRSYEQHYSKARERACETLHTIQDQLTGKDVRLVITGSAGLGVAKAAGIDFVQEVYATAAAVNTYIPGSPRAGSSRERSSFWAVPSTSSTVCGSGSWRPCIWTASMPSSRRTATASPPWARPCAPPTTPSAPLTRR